MSNLERYGLEWKSAQDFVCHPMDDGYWTPWHIAHEQITTLRQQLAKSEARVADLEADNAHQRERRNAARGCIQKMKAETLRKQADAAEEAIVCALRTVGNVDPFEVNIHKFANDYAQRLRQQADEAERAGGE